MDIRLKFAYQNPLSSGWSPTDLERATAIDEEIVKILEHSSVKATTFPLDQNDAEAIVVMKRDTFKFEWRVYAFRNRTQLALWSVVEEALSFERAGFEIHVYIFQHELEGSGKGFNMSTPDGLLYLVPKSFRDFQRVQQHIALHAHHA